MIQLDGSVKDKKYKTLFYIDLDELLEASLLQDLEQSFKSFSDEDLQECLDQIVTMQFVKPSLIVSFFQDLYMQEDL